MSNGLFDGIDQIPGEQGWSVSGARDTYRDVGMWMTGSGASVQAVVYFLERLYWAAIGNGHAEMQKPEAE